MKLKKKKIQNKLWIIKSRGFKTKNKALSYDLIIFQTLLFGVYFKP